MLIAVLKVDTTTHYTCLNEYTVISERRYRVFSLSIHYLKRGSENGVCSNAVVRHTHLSGFWICSAGTLLEPTRIIHHYIAIDKPRR